MGRRYSRSPSPRGYNKRYRSPSPRDRYRYRSRGRDLPTSLLVRNLRHDCRPEDLRGPFGEFGPLKDIYLPRDYYTGEPRGFGFVQYVDPDDAAEAKYQMDGQVLLGRELTVVFAEENRKKPSDMRARERIRLVEFPVSRLSIHALIVHMRNATCILISNNNILDEGPPDVTPDHLSIVELTPGAQAPVTVPPLREEDVTPDPFHLAAGGTEIGLTPGLIMGRGAGAQA